MAVEIERRWLVSLPLGWIAKTKLHQCKRTEIVQTYLLADTSHLIEPNTRVRQCNIYEIGMPIRTECWQTTKKTIAHGTNDENEQKLVGYEYAWQLQHKDPDLHEIRKHRYDLVYAKQKFEFDLFKERLKGLAILELELDDIHRAVKLPWYLSIEKEVTGDAYYSNYKLAKLNTYLPISNAHLVRTGRVW
jgi:CYTH domain-containing protein